MFADINKKLAMAGANLREGTNIPAALLVGIMAISMSAPELIAKDHKEMITAKVLHSEAMFKNARVFVDEEVCTDVKRKVATRGQAEDGGIQETVTSVIGGVIGGVLGHQVGGGSGKTAATVGGAVLGTLAGKAAGKSKVLDRDVYEVSTECHTEQVQKTIQIADGFKIEAELPNGEAIFGKVNKESDTVQVEATTTYKIK